MKNIRTAILAVCMGALGSFALHAQTFLGLPASDFAYFSYEAFSSTTGLDDTASGSYALHSDTTGSDNSAFGYQALGENEVSNWNTAFGSKALYWNGKNDSLTPISNSAFGYKSLTENIGGAYNTAVGYKSLDANSYGIWNTALGLSALGGNKTGGGNIGIGHSAGVSLSIDANNNIDIGNEGSAGDNGFVRIGTNQTVFYVAGVNGRTTTLNDAMELYIGSDGQLGTSTSSIRFKEDVHDMGAASDGLMRLRPVTYRYKQPYADGSKPIDYGLIAEEVAEVYPDLVVKDADGQIQTVQYQKLTPMLLDEVQKEHRLLEQQEKTIEQQENSAAQQEETIQRLMNRLAALPLLEKRLAALEAAQPSATLEARLATK
jgi:hypothetical protein